MTGVVAIHQPNFFPWLGYFDKLRSCQVFVFLDGVAYPKSGSGMGSITNRVRIRVGNEARWIRCPVVRRSGVQRICDVEIDQSSDWRRKLLRTIELNYKQAVEFARVMWLLESLIHHATISLAEFNMNAIKTIAPMMGAEPRYVQQSRLDTKSHSTELLIEITRAVGGSTYLCGGGSAGYLDPPLFDQRGVSLVYQNYAAKPYGDRGKFIPGLSVIDYLMNVPYARWNTDF
jgi:hypothetical protein